MGREGESPELSDEDEWDADPPELCGNLNKWTNYIHGWQSRFMALKDGTLVYYRSSNETDFGCRGAISIQKAQVTPHEFDELRFDVAVNDCVWYLRANTVEDREKWINTLETYRRLDGERLKRHGSAMSLSSNTQSSNSAKIKSLGLTEKLSECETFKDILCQQIDTLQSYFDACADIAGALKPDESVNVHTPHTSISKELLLQHGLHSLDFKGEAITFKATTTGILATISYCIELMVHREEQLRRKLEREQVARKAAEDRCRIVETAKVAPVLSTKRVLKGGPDFEEGPHSQIGEDEFFDAVESSLDRLEGELEKMDQLKNLVEEGREDIKSGFSTHRLGEEIEQTTLEQLKYAKISVGPEEGVWDLFAEDGEMKMYKREEEVNGMVVDPLKAIHQVNGVTARELCHYFFAPDVRTEWEHTIENMSVLEEVDPDTLVFLQVHKRLWPAAQRDALFWSHIRRVEPQDPDVVDAWIVCNKSCEHPGAPLGDGGCLRVDLVVCFLCQTVVPPGKDKNDRNNLTCRITYCSVVNPGGWAPATVLRAVYKREYPRFLKRFTQYVGEKTKDKPVLW